MVRIARRGWHPRDTGRVGAASPPANVSLNRLGKCVFSKASTCSGDIPGTAHSDAL
jgi:hypothetical protein